MRRLSRGGGNSPKHKSNRWRNRDHNKAKENTTALQIHQPRSDNTSIGSSLSIRDQFEIVIHTREKSKQQRSNGEDESDVSSITVDDRRRHRNSKSKKSSACDVVSALCCCSAATGSSAVTYNTMVASSTYQAALFQSDDDDNEEDGHADDSPLTWPCFGSSAKSTPTTEKDAATLATTPIRYSDDQQCNYSLFDALSEDEDGREANNRSRATRKGRGGTSKWRSIRKAFRRGGNRHDRQQECVEL